MQMDDGMFADLRVAILDDNRNFQVLLRTMLRHLGFRRVDSFTEPAEALTHVCEAPVDLVFVDYLMPHQTGAEWTRIVRRLADVANPEMAIILVTGRADHATIDAALAAGVDDVLAKPLAPETLLRHIRLVLQRPRRYIRTAGGYYGPEIAPTLRRLRDMTRPHTPTRMPRQPVAAPSAPTAPRRSVPGLAVEMRAPVEVRPPVEVRAPIAYPDDAMFLD